MPAGKWAGRQADRQTGTGRRAGRHATNKYMEITNTNTDVTLAKWNVKKYLKKASAK